MADHIVELGRIEVPRERVLQCKATKIETVDVYESDTVVIRFMAIETKPESDDE